MKSLFWCISNSSVLSVILFFSSCSAKSDNNKDVIKALQESMGISNTSINMSSTQILYSIDEKSRNYSTKERAGIWLIRAQKLQKLSEEIFNYLEGLKKTNKVNSETANELYARLMKHKQDILSVDSSIRHVFANNLNLISTSFDTAKLTGNDFSKAFFKNSTPLLTSAMLTKLQNNIKIIENKMLIYCHENIGVLDGVEYFIDAIVGQNSSILKPDETIKITAGVGEFSTKVHPEIVIKGKRQELTEAGLAEYKAFVPKKPGKYSIPVIITYIDFDGNKATREFSVEYTVAKECDQ